MTDPNYSPADPSPTPPPPPPTTPPIDYARPAAGGLFDPPPLIPVEMNKDARLWGMLAHLTAFSQAVGVPLGHIFGPMIIWLIKKDEMPYVNDQAKESLNFQITVTLALILLTPTICIGVGLIVLPALGVIDLVFIVIASIKANAGEPYRYPFSLRLIK